MASISFTDYSTVIPASWLNDVNTLTYTVWNGVSTIGQARNALGLGSDVTKTLSLAGNLATSGAYNLTLTLTGATNVTLPTTGTVATTSNKLSAFAATTSAELAGVISDETGSGALVFANTPTLVTPNIGAATGTSVALSGGASIYSQNLSPYAFKNLVQNGAMELAQRGTSFAPISSGSYFLDRYRYINTGAAVHTITQDSDVPTVVEAGVLYTKSMKIDCTTADGSVAAGDVVVINQGIEGYVWRQCAQRTFTLSFWVKATKTGTYCVSFSNNGADRSYVAEYTVNAANTWEFKTITVTASPSAGTWDYTNSAGLYVRFCLMGGSTYQTTAGSWATGDYRCTSNQVNACDSTSNDFWITGIQLEPGSVATPFELRPIGLEEILCWRYYQAQTLSFNHTTGSTYSSTACYAGRIAALVPMRTTPSIVLPSAGTGAGQCSYLRPDSASPASFGSLSTAGATRYGFEIEQSGMAAVYSAGGGDGVSLYFNAATLSMAAEL